MRRLIWRVWPLIPALLIELLSSYPVLAAIDPADESRILRTSQIHAGMQGYGLTVFRGDTIERFDVKVLGVLPKQNTGRPLILVRVGGGELSKREINIAEGMSGSPVYVGGKLIGAVAYAGSFAREPLGLVTPIEDMLEAWDPTLPAIPPGFGDIKPLPGPLSIGGATLRSIGIRAYPGDPGGSSDPGQAWFSPMATPLVASGFSQRSIAALGGALGGFSLSVMQGPGRMSGRQIALREGSAVGFSLATGDVELTGIGTVTYRRGESILAFGHPFLSMGAIGMPMSTCWVHDVFPSYSASFKLASPVLVVGASTQDRPFSMAGSVGKTAEMLPVELTVRDDRSPAPLRFKASVLKHPIVTPMITRMIAAEAVERKRPYPGEGMARVTTTVVGKDVGPVTRTNLFFSPIDIGAESTGDLNDILGLFQANKFHPIVAERVTMDVQIIQTRQTAEVERIMLDKSVFEPGETVDIAVQMRPYRADPVIRRVQIKVPESALDGRAIVAVQGGSSAGGASPAPVAQAMQGSDKPGMPDELKEAATIQQLFTKFQEMSNNNELVGRLLMPSASFSVEGERLEGLPPGMEYAMQSKKTTSARMVRDETKVRQRTDWYVSGTQVLSITIQRKTHAEKPARGASSLAPAVSQPSSSTESDATKKTITTGDEEVSYEEIVPSGAVPASLESRDSGEIVVAETDSSEESTASATDSEDAKDAASDSTTTAEGPQASAAEKGDGGKLADLGRTTQTWRQAAAADFLKGEMSGVAVGSALAGPAANQADGFLQPGLELKRMAALEDSYIWSVCPGPGRSVVAGTGSKGAVYRVSPGGAAEKLFSVSGTQALAVVRDRRGRLWAGSSPDGGIWLYADGKASRVAQAPSKHVSALAPGPEDSVLAGAGDSGKIWRVTPDGTLSLWADTDQLHIQCLSASADGGMLAGTAGTAAVWRISEGRAEALFDASEEFVGSVVCNAKGAIYATTGPKGKLYRIERGKAPLVLIEKLSSNLTPLALDSDGAVVAVDSSRIYRFPESGGQTVQPLEDQWDFQALAALDGGGLAAGTTNGGSLWGLSPAREGWFDSAVRDAERPAAWGRMRALVTENSEGALFKVRSGDVAEPGASWSHWRQAAPGAALGLKEQRYLQYRIEFKTAGKSARVADVGISYLPVNRPPTVKFDKPAAGTGISGVQEITWSGTDPDSDKLTYELSYSADGGKAWNPIGKISAKAPDKKPAEGDKPAPNGEKAGVKAEADASGEQKAEPDTNDLLSQTKKALDARTDIPAAMRERMLATAQKAIERSKAAKQQDAKTGAGTTTNGTTHKWDTAKVADGQYMLRVTASDVLANSSEALSAQAFLGPLLVCNTKPTLTLARAPIGVTAGGDGRANGMARSKPAEIAAVQFRLDKTGDWYAAEPDDGMFDSPDEPFTCVLRGVKPGKHTLEVQAKDSAGNVTKASREFEVSAIGKDKPESPKS